MAELTASPPCIICGAREQATLCRTSFGWIARCRGCGLVRTMPPRTAAELAALHATSEYFAHPYFQARRALGDSVRQKQRTLLSGLSTVRNLRGARLLDVGCDTGALLAVARDEFGMIVEGIDVAPEAARVAVESHGVHVHVGTIDEVSLPESCFDVITLVDVIEHTVDPAALLASARRLLRPQGVLYIATSDHDALLNSAGLALYRIAGERSWPVLEKLYIPYHEFYLSRDTLARLVRAAGCSIVRHTGREFPLDEFGHGLLLKAGVGTVQAIQRLFGRHTLQELVAIT